MDHIVRGVTKIWTRLSDLHFQGTNPTCCEARHHPSPQPPKGRKFLLIELFSSPKPGAVSVRDWLPGSRAVGGR